MKLQALVRGHLVRKQAKATLRCMQALVTAQVRARAQRIQMGSEGKANQKHRNAAEDDLLRHIYNVSFITAIFFYSSMIVENEISRIDVIYNIHDDVKSFVYLQYLSA